MPLVISRSLWRKLLVMSIAVVGFVLLYDVGTFDSLKVAPVGVADHAGLSTGTRHQFTATAYCKGTTTASGVGVRTGIAASDPAILPVGSVVNITTGATKHNGVYTIMDTGPKVQGRIVDLYMWSCHDALAFGRQQIEVTVLRLGWNPGNSVPSLVDRLFRRREASRAATLAAPPTVPDSADGNDVPASDADGGSAEGIQDGVPIAAPPDISSPPDLSSPPDPAPSEAPPTQTPPVAAVSVS